LHTPRLQGLWPRSREPRQFELRPSRRAPVGGRPFRATCRLGVARRGAPCGRPNRRSLRLLRT
jgi:hypothetical protein